MGSCPVPDVETADRNRTQFKKAQAEMIVTCSRISLDDPMFFKNAHEPVNGTLVQLHHLRKLGQTRVFLSVRERVNNRQRSVEHLNLIR